MTEETKLPPKFKPIQAYTATHREVKMIAAEEGRDMVDVVADMVAIYKGIKRKGGKALRAGKPVTASEFIAANAVQ